MTQKSTKGNLYEVQDNFIIKLQDEFPMTESLKIAKLINKNLKTLTPKHSCTYGGVVHTPNPTFFSVDCIKLSNKVYSFTDIREIDCDDYLDLINEKLILNEI